MSTSVEMYTLMQAAEWGLIRNLEGQTFVLTGKMSTERANIMNLIRAADGQVEDRVHARTTALVIPFDYVPPKRQTRKVMDAYKYGVRVLDERELVDMILPTAEELDAGTWATPPF